MKNKGESDAIIEVILRNNILLLDEIKTQEGLIMNLMRDVGRTLMEGKNIVGISLPVIIFEPRSTLERITDNWAFLPIYLRMASSIKD